MSEQPEDHKTGDWKPMLSGQKLLNLTVIQKSQFAMKFQSEISDDFSQGPKFAEESI